MEFGAMGDVLLIARYMTSRRGSHTRSFTGMFATEYSNATEPGALAGGGAIALAARLAAARSITKFPDAITTVPFSVRHARPDVPHRTRRMGRSVTFEMLSTSREVNEAVLKDRSERDVPDPPVATKTLPSDVSTASG